MKGQAQAVTAVLITSVVVGAIATSYTWGVPLLEKQQAQAELQRTEQNSIGLYDRIVEVSESGEGTTARFDLGQGISADDMRISLSPSGNYIDVRVNNPNPPYPMDTWTLVKGNNMQNLTAGRGPFGKQGTNLPGAVLVRPVGAPDSSLITYRIEFRNLYEQTATGSQLTRINLSAEGGTVGAESTTLFISNQGTNWERGNDAITLPEGEIIPRKNTEITIGFR